MSARRPRVTQAELRETMKTIAALGFPVRGCKIDPQTGCVEILFGKPEPAGSVESDLDKLEERFG